MRPRRAQFGSCLIWLAALTLIASVALGGQAATLCISHNGGVDIRPVAEACMACPVSTCPSKPSQPVDLGDSQLSDDEDCCYDLPLAFDPPVCIMTRDAEVTDTLLVPSSPDFIIAVEAMVASLPATGPPTDPSPHHVRQRLTCLHSVLLLL